MRLNLKQIVACCGGQCVVDPIDMRTLATGLTWDSRTVLEGDIYVALQGERVDGHNYIDQALRKGAVAALVMQPIDDQLRLLAQEMGAAIIEVPDSAHAISDIAAAWRTHITGTIIALTGSTGKTTTKNLVRDVLASAHSVVATQGNQNNELGVPNTLLRAEADTQYVVVEMGMRGQGQISQLCDFVRPDWGLLVNVGESHIELLGSRDNIARAKAELLCALPEGRGAAFVNLQDEYASFVREHAHLDARQITTVFFDGSEDALAHREQLSRTEQQFPAVWAEEIKLDDQGHPEFMLCASGFQHKENGTVSPLEERVPCKLILRGVHNVSNACAAVAVGKFAGMSLEACALALRGAQPEVGRQEVLKARGGFSVINDAYNANPDSMRASLATFSAMNVAGRKVAVLGDMGELGSFAKACHRGIGEYLATLALDRVICVGELAQDIADGALDAGADERKIIRANSLSEVLGDLDSWVESGDAVLVKASHFMGLERVVEGLIN